MKIVESVPTQKYFFSRKQLPLKDDVAGARQWAVFLDRVMLTYFEIEPGCRFERHAHDSEQITLVLEGELIFRFDGGDVWAGAGEVVAVPSGIPHAVDTGQTGAKAVDAWSPPAAKYKETS